MNLRKALKSVLLQGDAPQLLLQSQDAGGPAVVSATDSGGIRVEIDQDVPNLLVNAEQTRKAIGPVGMDAAVKFSPPDHGAVTLTAGLAEHRLAASGELQSYPTIPGIRGEIWLLGDHWDAVLRLVKFAATTGQYAAVRFLPDRIEATDTTLFARYCEPTPFDLLVPRGVFLHCPKGDASVWYQEPMLVFQVGDERRWVSVLPKSGYPATDKLMPAVHQGGAVVVDTKQARQAVDQLSKVSNDFGMHIGIENGRLVLCSGASARVELEILDGSPAVTPVLVSAALLARALKGLDSVAVALCFGEPGHPLRIESGSWVHSCWPLAISSV